MTARVAHGANRGGRNNRLNWTDAPDGSAVFGDYSIQKNNAGTKHPWTLCYKGEPMLRSHGSFTGYQRFATPENAKRWVEARLAKRANRCAVASR
jgi:hypothetical protein